MKQIPDFVVRGAMLMVLVTILSGCATTFVPSPKPVLPALPASLMTDDSADSLAYSQRVRDWLKKVADELSSSPSKN